MKAGWRSVCERYDYVTMEGSGGILCPLRWDAQHIQLEDVVKSLGLASILVAEAGLGTINSVVLTAEYMKAKGLPFKGIIFNHYHPGGRQSRHVPGPHRPADLSHRSGGGHHPADGPGGPGGPV